MLDDCELFPESLLGDAVAYETGAWAREAAQDYDAEMLCRVLDLWSDALDHPRVDPNLACAITAALGTLNVRGLPGGREAAERVSLGMRHLMDHAPRMVRGF